MKAFVTGVAGFVGSTLARRLLDDGWSVVGVDVLSDYYALDLKQANLAKLTGERFEFHQVDLLQADLDGLLRGVDVVFHEAGQPGVRSSWGAEFAIYTENNIRATQVLLEAAVRLEGLQRFVYASSSSVYGDAERYPTEETDRPAPVSPYGVTKLAAEHLCSLYARNFGLPTVSLRYFTVYGPGQRPDMAFTRFLQAAANDTEIVLYGTGDQIRDFTFISDVVEANVLAATRDVPPGTVLNIAGGTNISVNEVFALIEKISGATLRIRREPVVKGDVWRTGGSSVKAHELLGWTPKVGIEEGLTHHYRWAQEHAGR